MDDELRAVLAKLVERIETESAVQAAFRDEQAAFRAEEAAFRAEVTAEFKAIHAEFRHLGERVARVEGRLEEQSKVLQVALAGRLPRKPAA